MIKQLHKFILLSIAAMAMVLSFSHCSPDDDSSSNQSESEDDCDASLYIDYMYYNTLRYNLSAYYEYEEEGSDNEEEGVFIYNSEAYIFGKVIDEATPTEYYLSVVDLDAAKLFFTDSILSGIGTEYLETGDDGSLTLDMGDYGSVRYYESSAVDGGLATIDISISGLKEVTKFHLIDEDMWSENTDESGTEGVRAGIMYKDSSGTIYICTRAATGSQQGLLLRLSVVSGENSSSHRHYFQSEWAGMGGTKKMFKNYPSLDQWKDIFAVAYDPSGTTGTRANFLKYLTAVGITDTQLFDAKSGGAGTGSKNGTYPIGTITCGAKYTSGFHDYRTMYISYVVYSQLGSYIGLSQGTHSIRTDYYNENNYCYFISFKDSSDGNKTKYVNFNWVSFLASDDFYSKYSTYSIRN